MIQAEPKRTPLYDRHVALGGSMVDFGGYAMPQQYSGIREEHLAVRQRAGIFDISHMGEVRVWGPGALTTLQRLCANNVARLTDGQALYGVMCNPQGGIVDDIIIYRDTDSEFMVVINAARHDEDVAWIKDNLAEATEFEDLSSACALLAVQGPEAVSVIAELCDAPVGDVKPFHSVFGRVAGIDARISRTGYTGEDGFELYVLNHAAAPLWDAILEAGKRIDLRPCGLGARDTLRLEAGLRLYGQDMDDSTDPFSAGLAWTVKLDKGIDCIGADALGALDPQAPPRRFVGVALEGRAIARHGQAVMAGATTVGEITSGTYSFTLGHGIATASIVGTTPRDAALTVDIRGAVTPVRTVPLPFYKRPVATEDVKRG